MVGYGWIYIRIVIVVIVVVLDKASPSHIFSYDLVVV